MKKKILIIILFFFILFPINVFGISKDYVDKVSSITGSKTDDKKINFYLFYGRECPHCEQERTWLKKIQNDYKDYVNVYMFEVWHNNDNAELMNKVIEEFNVTEKGVPLTVIGDSYFVGYSTASSSRMEAKINSYCELEDNPNKVKLPILGYVELQSVSIPLVAVILGFIDGFNPCAMWILLFLINMLFKIKNKKKAWILGLTFLLISGLVYLLSMIGINLVLTVMAINMLKIIIAIFILIAGVLNLRKYFKTRKKDAGCEVVDDKKRKKIITKMKRIIDSKSFVLALVGIIILAASVNLIELACSLGFPVIFNELLTINNVTGTIKLVYLLIYIIFYMIDDILVFSISMFTLEAAGITNKYNKLSTLISAIIMIIMGLLLIFKPDWLMLNF